MSMKALLLAARLAPALSPAPATLAPAAEASSPRVAASGPTLSAAAPAIIIPAPALTPDEARAAVSGWDLLASVDRSGEPTKSPQGRARRTLRLAGRWLAPPVIEPGFRLDESGYEHHGMSAATLASIAAGDGALKKHTYFSDEGGFSWSYAGGAARYDRSIGVVLRFPRGAIDEHLVTGHYQPTIGGDKMGPIKQLATYRMSIAPLPLALQDEKAKSSVLGWLERMRVAQPGNPAWPRLLAAFETAFGRSF